MSEGPREHAPRPLNEVGRDSDQPPPPVPADPADVVQSSPELPVDGDPPVRLDAPGSQVSIAHTFEFSAGPLPRPDDFQAYEDTLPGAAHRILAIAEKQQEHRHNRQIVQQTSEDMLAGRGQWMGFSIAMLAIGGGVMLLALDKSLAGFATLLPAIGGIAGSFLWSRRHGRNSSGAGGTGPAGHLQLPTPPTSPPEPR